MDYDDNDFQNQNFQLAGDDNNKFPSSLRSFALPKFDLDDQVHLRFDSLIETEILLGIQGQDNNWIEDFSRGASAIDFSSSAAESCSISRRNNVWSEATSSESVEMLLKSVGEDQMIDKKDTIMDADTHYGLSGVEDQIDPLLRQDDQHGFKMEDNIQTDPPLPPDKVPENSSGLGGDASEVQPLVEHISNTLKEERSREVLNASPSGEKFDSTIENNLVNSEVLSGTIQTDTHLHMTFMRKTVNGDYDCDESAVVRGSSVSISCRRAQDDRSTQVDCSSISVSNLGVDSGKLSRELEQVVEEHSEIIVTERSDLVSDNTTKEEIHTTPIDSTVNEDQVEGSQVKGHIYSGKSCSFLEPTIDSLVSFNQGCNESAENRDGLLEAIAYPVKALNKETEEVDKFPKQTEDMCLLETEGGINMERGRYIERHSVEMCIDDTPKLIHVAEGSEDVGHGQPDRLSNVGYSQVEMPNKNAEMIDDHEEQLNTPMEVIQGKESSDGQLSDNNSSDVGNNTELTVEAHALMHMTSETEKDTHISTINIASSVFCNPESVVVEKSNEAEVIEMPDANLASHDVALGESPSPSLVNLSEVSVPSFDCGKSDEVCTALVAETSDVEIATLEVTVKNDCLTAMHSEAVIDSISNDDDNAALGKADDSPSAGQSSDTVIVVDGSPIRQDESGVDGHASGGAELVSLGISVDIYQSNPDDSMVDGVIEHKDETSPTLVEPDFIHSDEKDAEASETPGPNSDTATVHGSSTKQDQSGIAGLASVSAEYVSPRKSSNIFATHPEDSLGDGVLEQKDGTIAILDEPDFIHSNKKDVEAYAASSCSVLESNSHLTIDPVTILDPDCTDGSPSKRVMQDDSGVAADNMVVEQKDKATPSLLASELICFDKKETKTSANSSLSISEGSTDAPLSTGPVVDSDGFERTLLNSTTVLQPIVTGQSSSYLETIASIPCQSELQSLVEKSITHEPSSSSALEEKDGPDSLRDCSQEKESPLNISALTPSCFKDAPSQSFSFPGSNTEAHLLEAENGEPSCASPTVISCSEHSQRNIECHEGSKTLSDPAVPVLDDELMISSETGGNANNVKSNSHDSKGNCASKDDTSFTFEVGSLADLSKGDNGDKWKSFSSMQSDEDPQVPKENFQVCHSEPKEGKQHGIIAKAPDGDKTGEVTGSSREGATTLKGKPVKGTPISKKSISRAEKSCSMSPISVGSISRDMKMEEIRQHTYIESSSMKTSSTAIVHSSGLPDLNSSVSAATLFHQPFTDPQQIQLRAQIFVYGSLIQGISPDENCMVSAFGETDGGRSSWEGIWRLSVERCHNQKSPLGSCETPLHSYSGHRVPDQIPSCTSLQSKPFNTSSSRVVGKVATSATLNLSSPLPSPVWTHNGLQSNISRGTYLDFSHGLSPVCSYQSSQPRQYTSSNIPWTSQAPRSGPWTVSPQISTLTPSNQYSTAPAIETIQVTPIRDSSMPPRAANGQQLVRSATLVPPSNPVILTAAPGVHMETQRKTGSSGSSKNTSNVQKSRRRKKAAGPEDVVLTNTVLQSSAEPPPANVVTKSLTPLSVSEVLLSPANTPHIVSNALVSPTTHAPNAPVSTTTHIPPTPMHYQIVSDNAEQRVIFSEETTSKVEQAKLHAEDAAAHASYAVRHSEGIWKQLAAQRNSGLASETEEKLASAAVAAAAAASVAKAAAAATKVASDAALQAKMMADEALSLVKVGDSTQSFEIGVDAENSLARFTPGSLSKGKDKIHGSSSIISVARQAARRRVEAASAATKRAENLDAIVKAAELAAEAVNHAGTIIAMGDPLPFRISDLLEAGPEGFWKLHRSSEKPNKVNSHVEEEHMGLDQNDHHDGLVKELTEQPSSSTKLLKTANADGPSVSDRSIHLEANHHGSRSTKSSTIPNHKHESDHSSNNLKENGIQEGCLVEVISDEDGLRGGWFSARVLDVKDKMAFVCYNDLLAEEGSGQLKEWVSLEGERDASPRVRIAHPLSVAKYEGTRKRRREAVANYVWSVGDRVDVRMRDGWWEGIVTEKSQTDETKLTVHFPAGGDSSLVRAWDLRPSLIWKDGQWIEWSRLTEKMIQPDEGDTPLEKRQKLGRPEAKFDAEVDGREIGKLSKRMPFEDSRKPEESRPLNLSAKDQLFSVGKNTHENVSGALTVKRTGLQKEGSRVVFGVPKPGKKRKFMEVSKHYVADKPDKTNEGNNSLKFAKYLMPQASRSWKNSSKVDHKGKQIGESKPRGVKPVKSQNMQTRGAPVKGNSSIPIAPALNGGENVSGSLLNSRAGFGNEEKGIVKKNTLVVGPSPSTLRTTNSLIVESSVQPVSVAPASKKFSSAVESDIGVKERLTSGMDKSTRSEGRVFENSGKAISDAIEPRRSNRRIQPTSRLLEGLQSSLIISKIPSLSHDKGAKSLHRGSSSSRGNGRG